jgi:hypothetical protein
MNTKQHDLAPIVLRDCERLVGAKIGRFETKYVLKTYDDSWGPLWVYGHEFGPMMIIRAKSFETAYEIAIDESPTIPVEEVPEAYGFYGENAKAELDAAVTKARDGIGEYPELIEGYQYQSNCSGTGIVSVGHYEWLQELTPAFCKEAGIDLEIESDEDEDTTEDNETTEQE